MGEGLPEAEGLEGIAMAKKPIAEPAPTPEPAKDQAAPVFTLAELAARWRVSRHTVEEAIKDGRLQAFKPNKRGYRIHKAEVLRYENQYLSVAS